MTKEIEQVEYNSWDDKLKPGHEDYWAHIGYIAHFIASLLEGYQTIIVRDPKNPDKSISAPAKYNTISVMQYKEKFGQVRVYWTASDPMLVEQQYEVRHKKEQNMSLEQFREQCYKQDLIHYRNVYFIMKQCFPQYWHAVSSAADNSELLFESKEDYLDALNKEISRTKDEYRPAHLEREKDFIFDLLKWK